MHRTTSAVVVMCVCAVLVCADDKTICSKSKGLWCSMTSECVKKDKICDHLKDCPDNSDENGCACLEYERRCNGGVCVYKEWWCDGVKDCAGGEDETNCQECKRGEFECRNKEKCIGGELRCDGVADCADASDEVDCFSLNRSTNLLRMTFKRLNDLPVCADGWDEKWAHKTCSYLGLGKLDTYKALAVDDVGAYVSLSSRADVSKPITSSFETTSKCTSSEVVSLKCLPQECGTRGVVGGATGRYVVNGDVAGLGAWPWQVRLYNSGSFMCGGSLVSDKWVLTAAHCVWNGWASNKNLAKPVGTLEVRVGGVYLTKKNPHEQVSGISTIIIHPTFKQHLGEYDIALLKLASPVKFSNYVRPVCLPSTSPSTNSKNAYRVCVITGNGMRAQDLGASEHLLQARMNIMSMETCRRNYEFLKNGSNDFEKKINPKLMSCAGSFPTKNNINMCMGDSGGPLNCLSPNGAGRWEIYGINSMHSYIGMKGNCQATVHTRVDAAKDWVLATMKMGA